MSTSGVKNSVVSKPKTQIRFTLYTQGGNGRRGEEIRALHRTRTTRFHIGVMRMMVVLMMLVLLMNRTTVFPLRLLLSSRLLAAFVRIFVLELGRGRDI